MKMRKLFAGLAAAATLLSGLALGATTASAAEPEQTKTPTYGTDIVLNTGNDKYLVTANNGVATETPRTFKAVKVAKYVNVPDATKGPAVALQTVDTVKPTIVNALKNKDNGASGTVYTDNDGDPLVWLSNQKDADYRKFVTAIEDSLKNQATVVPTEAFATADGATNTKQLTLSFTEAGLYLIYDQSGDQVFTEVNGKTTTTTTVHAFQTILAGTSINGADPDITNGGNIAAGELDAKGSEKVETSTKNGFTFHKKNAEGQAVQGAVFAVKNSDNKYGTYSNGAWTFNLDKAPTVPDQLPDDAAAKAQGLFVSDSDGSIVVPDLEPGTYTVEEIKAADDYLQSMLPSFTVTIDNNGSISYNVDANDTWNLVAMGGKNETTGDVYVTNVKSITQLPLTGAAGTILFSAVGVLLAAAAGTVFLKSRSTKRALRA